jgi:hypothetical protein
MTATAAKAATPHEPVTWLATPVNVGLAVEDVAARDSMRVALPVAAVITGTIEVPTVVVTVPAPIIVGVPLVVCVCKDPRLDDSMIDDAERAPLQTPWLQVFVAHWSSRVQEAWKEPQVVVVNAVTP